MSQDNCLSSLHLDLPVTQNFPTTESFKKGKNNGSVQYQNYPYLDMRIHSDRQNSAVSSKTTFYRLKETRQSGRAAK